MPRAEEKKPRRLRLRTLCWNCSLIGSNQRKTGWSWVIWEHGCIISIHMQDIRLDGVWKICKCPAGTAHIIGWLALQLQAGQGTRDNGQPDNGDGDGAGSNMPMGSGSGSELCPYSLIARQWHSLIEFHGATHCPETPKIIVLISKKKLYNLQGCSVKEISLRYFKRNLNLSRNLYFFQGKLARILEIILFNLFRDFTIFPISSENFLSF